MREYFTRPGYMYENTPLAATRCLADLRAAKHIMGLLPTGVRAAGRTDGDVPYIQIHSIHISFRSIDQFISIYLNLCEFIRIQLKHICTGVHTSPLRCAR